MISKAAFIVECAYFVRRCSNGQWPEWMRLNLIPFRSHETYPSRTNGNSSGKINKIYQAASARMFYLWGEVIHSLHINNQYRSS